MCYSESEIPKLEFQMSNFNSKTIFGDWDLDFWILDSCIWKLVVAFPDLTF